MPPNASRDQNFVTTLLAVSNIDGVTPVKLYADPVTHRLLTSPSGSGAGDVVGPASSTDNAIARFDLTTGKLLQNSNVTISDTGAITVAGAFTLPVVDGSNLQVLTTNGAGVVSWSTPAGAGTVTSVSVVTANGFAGTVATATSTPAITLTTSLNTPVLAGNGTALVAATTTGTGSTVVLDTSPTLVTPALGVATATSLNGLTVTTTTGTLTIANGKTLTQNATQTFAGVDGKTLTFNNSITFAGTDSTVMTFPTTSATIARTDAAQTFTGVQTMTSPSITTSIVTASTSFLAWNTTATTFSMAGAATTMTIGGTPTTAITHNYSTNATATATTKTVNIATAGAAGSTTNVNIGSATTSAILGTLSLNFPTILTSVNNTTVSLWNTLSTTINFAGAATTMTIGGTPTTTITHNYSTNATAAATVKTVNLGTGGAASSTTNVNIGSANGGTTNIASPTLQSNGVAVPTISSTSTLTNKRIQPRTNSTTTASNLSPDLSTANIYYRTTQTATLTIDAPIGTPVIGETIMIYVNSVAAQTLTINATYIPFGVAFPATTTAGKTFMMSAQFNGTSWNTLWANAV